MGNSSSSSAGLDTEIGLTANDLRLLDEIFADIKINFNKLSATKFISLDSFCRYFSIWDGGGRPRERQRRKTEVFRLNAAREAPMSDIQHAHWSTFGLLIWSELSRMGITHMNSEGFKLLLLNLLIFISEEDVAALTFHFFADDQSIFNTFGATILLNTVRGCAMNGERGVKNERAISTALEAYGGSLPLTDFISLAKKFPVLLRPVQFLQKRLRDQTLGEERWLELTTQASAKLALSTINTTVIHASTTTTSTSTSTSSNPVIDRSTSLPSKSGGDSMNNSTSGKLNMEMTMGTTMNAMGQGPGQRKEQGPGTGPNKLLSHSKTTGDVTIVRSIDSLIGVTDLKRTLRNLSALMNEAIKEEEVAKQNAAESSMGKLLRLGPMSTSEKTFESPRGKSTASGTASLSHSEKNTSSKARSRTGSKTPPFCTDSVNTPSSRNSLVDKPQGAESDSSKSKSTIEGAQRLTDALRAMIGGGAGAGAGTGTNTGTHPMGSHNMTGQEAGGRNSFSNNIPKSSIFVSPRRLSSSSTAILSPRPMLVQKERSGLGFGLSSSSKGPMEHSTNVIPRSSMSTTKSPPIPIPISESGETESLPTKPRANSLFSFLMPSINILSPRSSEKSGNSDVTTKAKLPSLSSKAHP